MIVEGSVVPFAPSWESLEGRETPEWFPRAKFGLWAHWGPQCQPGFGDWYARTMDLPGTDAFRYHRERYGHPSQFGFKDVTNECKASRWDPEELVALYARTGARYFVAMADHHDNLDLWDSPRHAWNSVRVGPRHDIVGEWAAAARSHGLRLLGPARPRAPPGRRLPGEVSWPEPCNWPRRTGLTWSTSTTPCSRCTNAARSAWRSPPSCTTSAKT
ncbi:alpha-L-fucosidase [Nonomuraea sp. NPDC004580]|uniref:alpha-L-fucosidase n=1 Tax=Nonomuraea sp. NPDC004580 TaxID=3154552 RepID=UPI0033A201AB